MNAAQVAARERGVVIVGAGQAGGRAAEALRGNGFDGDITLIGDEAHRPYERPSLSKEMLLDPAVEPVAWLHAPEYYDAQRIDWRGGVTATHIDRVASRLELSDGDALDYGALILATGSRARRLPFARENDGVLYVRTLDDSRRLRDSLRPGARLVIVGAGFVGLEVAAAATMRGCSVEVVEIAGQPLGRVAPPMVQQHVRAVHERNGVRFRFGTAVTAIDRNGAGYAVTTAQGDILPADLVVVGIGADPNEELAAAAGLTCDRGIVVDRFGATDDPVIFAAGDVANHEQPLFGRHVLLESWQNAQNQANAIARNLARDDAPAPYAEVPWFWSDQFDLKLQIYGLPEAGGTYVFRGDDRSRSWIVGLFVDQRLRMVAGMNASARDLRPLRDLIATGARVGAAAFSDLELPTVQLLRRATAQLAA